jgi:hypothetical protein
MCVVKEGQRDPAARRWCSTASTRSIIVTPGTTSDATAAIVRSTVSIARPIEASSSSVLTRRSSLTIREPVRRRSNPRARPRWSVVSAHTRSPIATDPEPSIPATARRKISAPSSVSLTTITSPAGSSWRSKAANMRGKRKTGSRFGRKRAPVAQPCWYEIPPKFGTCRSTPVRYSRSADGARKSASMPSASSRSDRRRCRSAWSNTVRCYASTPSTLRCLRRRRRREQCVDLGSGRRDCTGARARHRRRRHGVGDCPAKHVVVDLALQIRP